ncbi:MAG: FliM/FliN family flagellar motor switch protein [Myxococcota bacterium]|jgi:flagellar motor switch protein FliM|nr:FliM/FliN family flagellar motor switch protein [Myxococcota bacterium]
MMPLEAEEPVLSREELDALLERLTDKSAGAGWSTTARKDTASEARHVSLSLERASEAFGDRISRSLSNVFQTPIRFSLIDWRESEPEAFEELMVPFDRAAAFDIVPGAGRGLLLIGRTLLFQLLCMNFGASPGLKKSPVPNRNYTSIECRIYRKIADDLVGLLAEGWSDETPLRPKITGLIGRSHVREEVAESLYLATFDISGFGEVCRLRVAVPTAAFDDRVAAAREVATQGACGVEETVLDMSLTFRAKIGTVDMSLRDFSNLAVGDVLPLDEVEGGKLLASVAGIPKFHAIRGAVGNRLAVQLQDRI